MLQEQPEMQVIKKRNSIEPFNFDKGSSIVNYNGLVEDYWVKPKAMKTREVVYSNLVNEGEPIINPYNFEWDCQVELPTDEQLNDTWEDSMLYSNLYTLRVWLGDHYCTWKIFCLLNKLITDERISRIDSYAFSQWTADSDLWMSVNKENMTYSTPVMCRGEITMNVTDTLNCEFRTFFYPEYQNETIKFTSDDLIYGEHAIGLYLLRTY